MSLTTIRRRPRGRGTGRPERVGCHGRNAVIVAHMQRMESQESQLPATQAAVASLRSLLERPALPMAVEHRSAARVPALAISERVAMADVEAWWMDAFTELDGAPQDARIVAAGPRGALYPAELFELEAGDVVAYVPVPPSASVGSSGRARMTEISAAELAVAVHHGAFADLDQTYAALGMYVAEREISVEAPIRELYLVTPFDTEDESLHVTEVCWPIFQTAPAN